MTPERAAQMRESLNRLGGADPALLNITDGHDNVAIGFATIGYDNTAFGSCAENPTVVEMRRVRRERAERLRTLRLRPWWRKVWDGVVYVVTGREP